MHKKYDNQELEGKWRAKWAESDLYNVGERDTSKEKEYILVEWPYPSGNLHVGHWYAFAVPDIYVRYKRMNGKQMLYPMGFDAFGLPAENAAIKRGLDPKAWTNDNIAYMKEQLGSMGCSFSWDKTTSSTDPDYYRWTQWMFTKFFENGVAYRGKGVVNWCPHDNTVIANEQVLADGTCERCGNVIEKIEMPQWMLRITKYADRLVDDLETVAWPEHIKEAQRQWIGRSDGAQLSFTLSTGAALNVFTTRPDTLFGATYMVLAPEHPLVEGSLDAIQNWEEVSAYIKESKAKAEQDRLDDTKEKTGVKLEGVTATNPASGEEIPVFIADYVLASYGTGAIMAVPAHDERDYAFAEKFGINIKPVVKKYENVSRSFVMGISEEELEKLGVEVVEKTVDDFFKVLIPNERLNEYEQFISDYLKTGYWNEYSTEKGFHFIFKHKDGTIEELDLDSDTNNLIDEYGETFNGRTKHEVPQNVYEWLANNSFYKDILIHTEGGSLINSGEFDGMDSEAAKEAITKKVGGEMTKTYRLRDWSVGRQRYWGVPIPIVYDPEGNPHPVKEEHLPWLLPEDVDPTPTGVPPLEKSAELKKRTEELYGEGWTPEVETLDTFVDSSWYYLRYLDVESETSLSSLERQKEWMPIDAYFGGAEHTTMHLLYSRFWQKALFDLSLVQDSEPYKKRINRGLILGPDGNKMSKSKGNVIDPDEQVKRVGADSVKMYLAFMGPYEGSNYPWDMGGIAGIRRFLERVYGLDGHIKDAESETMTRQLHKTVLKVGLDIASYKFNTAISAMMIYVNMAEKEGLSKDSYLTFLRTIAPFAPFLTEELWEKAGHTTSIHAEAWPVGDSALAADNEVTLGVQVNGKVRGSITIASDADEETAVAAARAVSAIAERLDGVAVKKIVYVPKRILSILTDKQE